MAPRARPAVAGTSCHTPWTPSAPGHVCTAYRWAWPTSCAACEPSRQTPWTRAAQATGFWDAVRADPFSRAEWLDALRLAPGFKADFFTILSDRDCLPEAQALLGAETVLEECFV